jgi:Tfp pilus assembly protein PilF
MLEKGIQLEPTSVYAHYQLAVTYSKDGKRDQAIRELREVARLQPVNALEASYKAQAQKELGQLGG